MPGPDAASSPHDLIAAARDVMRIEDASMTGRWPRTAAMLARQSIELAMNRLWELTAPGLRWTSARCQLLCLGTLLNDGELGGRVHATWNELSEACHHRVYALPPDASELKRSLETAWDLADSVEQLRAKMRR